MNIPVVEKILNANDLLAAENRARLDAAGVVALNLMASPGAGKTALIERTVRRLKSELRIGMVNGDIATSFDAERAREAGALAVQINTGGNCHLEASMVRSALDQLPLAELDLLVIENVGNLVCPASWQLGAHYAVLVASIPEGDDKPYKYPGMYQGVDALVINKIDLLPYVPFDIERFRRGVEALNPGVQSFTLSCQTGEGFETWLAWVRQVVSR